MTRRRSHNLEVITHLPIGEARPTPLLFIHGAYAGAWCWQEYYLPFFAEAGYACHALSLSGHGASPGREWLDSLSLDDFVNDVVTVAGRLPEAPILIGHSMGGMIAQKYLERSEAAGAVLMASVPPQGLSTSALGLAVNKPGLMMDLNRLLGGGRISPDALLEILFVQPPAPEKLRTWYRKMQPESFRAIWDMTLFNLPRLHTISRPPMLVLGAEYDHLIPPSLVEMTSRSYGVEAEIFREMGHGMMLENNWRGPAEHIRNWLIEHQF